MRILQVGIQAGSTDCQS